MSHRWMELFRVLRPGSRTVLYVPEEQEAVVEFARRGFRLLLVHGDREFLQGCKMALRDQGLQSQLMGSQELSQERSLTLARDFYDIFLYCSRVDDSIFQVTDWLGPGATVIVPRGTTRVPQPDKLVELVSFSESFRGFREIT